MKMKAFKIYRVIVYMFIYTYREWRETFWKKMALYVHCWVNALQFLKQRS